MLLFAFNGLRPSKTPKVHRIFAAGLILGSVFVSNSAQAEEHVDARTATRVGDPPLLLSEVLQLVLEQNPELKAASFEVRGADVRREYAGQFLNPTVGISLEDFLGTGPLSGLSGAETTLRLSQTFPVGGRLGASTDVAAARLSATEAKRVTLRIRILAETVVRFMHVVADQHRLAVALQATELSVQGLEVAKRRAASGATTAVEERRASIALAGSRLNQEHAEHELLASKRRLSMMWGEEELRFTRAEADLFVPRTVPTYEELAARIEDNPELAQLAREQAVQSANLALAEASAIPDLQVSVGGRRFESQDAFALVFGVSMPIPLFQRNQGAVGVAQMKRSELGAQQEATRVRLLANLYGHVQEMKHAKEVLDTLQRDMLPDAKEVLKVVAEGFKFGRFSQIELLDAQQALIELERKRIDEAEDLLERMVRVNSILGAAEIESEPSPENPQREKQSQRQGENDDE